MRKIEQISISAADRERLEQDVGEERLRNGDLGHLKGDIAAVADDFRANLDQLLLQACQRPVLDRLGRREGLEEIAEIKGEGVKQKADGVGGNEPKNGSCGFRMNGMKAASIVRLRPSSSPSSRYASSPASEVNHRTAKVEHQPAVEIEPESPVIRFTPRVRHYRSLNALISY